MKKNLLVALSIGAMALAGCSPAASGGSTSKGIRVIFWHTFGDKIEAAVKDAAANFVKLVKANEGIDIEVELEHYGSYSDTRKIVGTALTGATGPSMCIAYPDSVAYLMSLEANEGQFVRRLDPYFDDSEIGFGKERYLGDGPANDFVESYITEGSSFMKKGTYVMPFMKSSEIMIYNKDMVAPLMKIYKPELTGEAVWEFVDNMSWDDLIALSQLALDNRADLNFTAMEEPIFYDSDSNMFITQLEQTGLKYSYLDDNGGVVLGLDKTANPTNYAAACEMLEEYRAWHTPKAGQSFGVMTTKGSENTHSSDYFKNRQCIFSIGSSGGAGYTFPTTSGMSFGISRVPYRGSESNHPKYISQGPSVVFLNDKSFSREKNEQVFKYSWKLYKYLTNNTVNTILCVNGSEGYVPVRESAYESEIWGEFLSEGTNYALAARVVKDDIGDNFISSLVFNGSASYRDYMTGVVSSVMTKTDTVQSILDTAVNNTKNDMEGK